MKAEAEIYKLPTDFKAAERVLRDQLVRIDGWPLSQNDGGADGTVDELYPQGTGGWTAGVLP